jgi:BTB/POZ domain-containing protein KCTD9
MHRLSFEETWKLLRETTNLIGENEPVPSEVGPAGYDKKGSGIDYYKFPEINVPAEGEEYGLWRLENLTMPSIFFCRCGIEDISFRNTSLVDSSFCWNDFINVDFTEADLSRCDMRCSVFENVPFVRADLRDADLRMSTFENCDFTDANMAGTKMTRSQAKNLSLSDKQMQNIAWKRSNGGVPKGG